MAPESRSDICQGKIYSPTLQVGPDHLHSPPLTQPEPRRSRSFGRDQSLDPVGQPDESSESEDIDDHPFVLPTEVAKGQFRLLELETVPFGSLGQALGARTGLGDPPQAVLEGQGVGVVEMGPAITVLYPEEQLPKAGAAGRGILNHEIRVVRPREDAPSEPDDLVEPGDEVGEVIVRGPSMMAGYYNLPEATAKKMYKGWYHSGDLARIDNDGHIWIADRVDDMIISGAENIYPREVEDALYEHPDVLEVAVIGRPDVKWGKVVTAFIVSKNPGLTAEMLDQYLIEGGRLAGYKRPRQYEFVSELPKTPSGKIQKFKLS